MKFMSAVVVLCCALALAAGTTYKLSINGQAFSTPAITVSGEIYVPLRALERAGVRVNRSSTALALTLSGAPSTAGGADQRASLEGCIGETLFNGIWRFRVTKLEAITRDTGTPIETAGWGVTVELRNGTRSTVQPVFTGMRDGGIQVAFADAQTITADGLNVQKLTFANLPPGGVVTHQLMFWYKHDTPKDQIKTPTKLLLEINPTGFENSIRATGAGYTTPTPSLRVRLEPAKKATQTEAVC